jgi:hypothetical protein
MNEAGAIAREMNASTSIARLSRGRLVRAMRKKRANWI